MENSSDLPEAQKENVAGIRSSAEDLQRIITDVLDLSKLENGSMQIETVSFDLRQVAEAALDSVANLAHTKDLEILLDNTVDGDPAYNMLGDPFRIKQCLLSESGSIDGALARLTELRYARPSWKRHQVYRKGSDPPRLDDHAIRCGWGEHRVQHRGYRHRHSLGIPSPTVSTVLASRRQHSTEMGRYRARSIHHSQSVPHHERFRLVRIGRGQGEHVLLFRGRPPRQQGGRLDLQEGSTYARLVAMPAVYHDGQARTKYPGNERDDYDHIARQRVTIPR